MKEPPKSPSSLFEAALELPETRRAGFLALVCEGDASLRDRVESLLRAHTSAGGFMQRPGVALEPGRRMVPSVDQTGDTVGRYKLLELIGEGGCGLVYRTEQLEPVRRQVALKIIKLGMDTKSVIARFEAERQALSMMDHPNIAKVLDADATATGRPYFVMELVKGIPITKYCDQKRIDNTQRLQLFVQVCRAVQHAHQKGIIHRDLKPSNVLVADHDGVPVPKIIDFGIAKATGNQRLTDKTLYTAIEQFMGTPAYMSPEQSRLCGLDIDTRSDIYSLGVLLYELLTGRTPFDGKRLEEVGLDEVRRIIRDEESTRPSIKLRNLADQELAEIASRRRTEGCKLVHLIRGDLDWIVMKAIEKERSRRYETANGLAADIERYLRSEPVLARPASASYRSKKFARRHKLLLTGIGAVATALVLGIVATTKEALRARAAEQQETLSRVEAETERQLAEEALRRTSAARTEARTALATFNFSEADRLSEADRDSEAVAYLSRILSSDPGNSAALARLTSLLTYHTWMTPTFNFAHDGWVVSAQFSPDGKRIVTASCDHTARVWNAQTGQPITEPLQHDAEVTCAQFSPDGQRLLTASEDHTARVWDAQTGRSVLRPLRHEAPVNCARFSPDGQRIITAASDNTAQIWDAQTGAVLVRFLNHTNAVVYAEFSPDGKRVVTASCDRAAQVWDAQTGQPLTGPLRHEGSVLSARFSSDGKRVVTASADKTARVWDAQTGQALTPALLHGGELSSAEFSPDGLRVLTSSKDKTARVWDAHTGQLLMKPLEHIRALASAHFSTDGKRIITACDDGTARVWDARTGVPVIEPLRHSGLVCSAFFSPNDQRIVTASADSTAQIWDIQTVAPLDQSLRHAKAVRTAQFSPDGRWILTGSYDGTARVWDAQTCQPASGPMKHTNAVDWAEFSADGRRVVTASYDHTARVWDAHTGAAITAPLQHGDRVNCAHFSPDGKWIVTASEDSTVCLWDASTGQLRLPPLRHPGTVAWAQFNPDGSRIVTAAWDDQARVWDAKTGEMSFSMHHDAPVAFAQFSPDGRKIVTASADNTAVVWDARTGQRLTPPHKVLGKENALRVWDAQTRTPLRLPFLHDSDFILHAVFSPDANFIVTSSRSGNARVWDFKNCSQVAATLVHERSVEMAQFSPDGQWLVTASNDNSARLWDSHSGQPLSEPFQHQAKVFMAQFSPDGRRIVTASRDGTARIWDIRFALTSCPAWLLKLAEALGGLQLDARGILQPTSLDRNATIAEIREYLQTQPDKAEGVLWGRWLLADRSSRTISPYSSITVSNYTESGSLSSPQY